jgi:DNA recombination protein RmuC
MAALIALLLLALLAGGIFAVAWLGRALQADRTAVRTAIDEVSTETADQLAERSAAVDRRLAALGETLDRRLGELDTKVDRRLGQLDTKVDRRLESAQKTSAAIHERLGKVDSAAAQMLERAKDLSRLEQALRPPKARGGFGELLLENLLRDALPPGAFAMQHGFATGERVDAVVKAGRLISVDSKFPLDNYQRLVEADSDDERVLSEKALARDFRNHIDAIAGKYIRPDEGTFDFAFMYVPVESVYYELTCGGLAAAVAYAHERRVFVVSPSTFTAYLQVIVLGLRGMQIEQRAHEVMAYVADLGRDFDKFVDDFELVGKHLGNASTKFGSAERRLERFSDKLDRATGDLDPTELEAPESAVAELGDDGREPYAIEAA